jgi:hypothetical protein
MHQAHPAYHQHSGAMPQAYFPGAVMPFPAPYGHQAHGFCHSCCHPKSKCICGCRECRKEAKELLVRSDQGQDDMQKTSAFQTVARMSQGSPFALNLAAADFSTGAGVADRPTHIGPAAAALQFGLGTAFIGGGCCVHLSVEYTPTSPAAQSLIAVLVQDSEGTLLAWMRTEKPGVGYQIKECIITTKPGATVAVLVVNMTARLRWCEVFSC